MAAASPTGSSASSTAVASSAALTRIDDRVDEAEGGDAAGGDRVDGAEQAVEPHGGEGLGDAR